MGRWVSVAVLCAGAAFARAAVAQAPPPAERAQVYSAYEQQTIDEVLDGLRASRDPSPEGKTIERVEIVPLDVFERRDPLPRALNVFHVTSRKRVIRRELLLDEDDRYEQVLVDDTLRNLRRLPQLSLVLVVAARGSAPDRVVLVVVTKDVWSLRLNWDVVATGGGLENLTLQPSETNFFGTHQTAFGVLILEPSAYTLGLGHTVPRVDGTRVAVETRVNVMVNRQSGSPEGSYGSLVAGQPLYSGVAQWAWDATVSWEDYPFRRYIDARPAVFLDRTTGGKVPFEYRIRDLDAAYRLTRSFGWDVKHDVTLAAGVNRQIYRATPSGDVRTLAEFVATSVPLSDTTVGPWVQYHSYAKRYVRVIDFDSLALQEDYHLGHDVVLRAHPSFRGLGGSRDVVDLYAAAQYTVPLRDGLFRASFVTDTAPEVDRIADAYILPTAHLATPTIAGLGRIVVDGALLYRWRNYLNHTDFLGGGFLGGGDRLRGYPTNFFVGQDYVAYNVELRSRPVEIFSCQIGGVVFFDAGDAFNRAGALEPFQSVGLGVRGLLPWLDRVVLRADLAFPLERPLAQSGARIPPYGAVVTFGQAFGVPTVAPPPALPTGESEAAQ